MDKKEMQKAIEPEHVKITKIGGKIFGTFVSIEPSTQHTDGFAIRFKNNKDVLCVSFINKQGADLILNNDLSNGDAFDLEFIKEVENQAKTYKYRVFELYFKKVE